MKMRNLLLLSAVLIGTLLVFGPSEVRTAPPAGGRERMRFDRSAFADEMARLSGDLKAVPTEALQAHGQRLAELYASLDLAGDLAPSERRAVGESLLSRVGEVGLVLRQRKEERPPSGARGGVGGALTAWISDLGDLGGLSAGGSSLLLGLLGGVVIAFALGSLAGYRRGTSQASYYGGEGDPRIRFLSRSADSGDDGRGPGRVSVTQLRDMLARGRPVMLQLGYEVQPEMRQRYLELVDRMRASMEGIDGQRYTVWEDPRHPSRFYELLVCSRPGALDRLLSRDWRLAALADEIETCRTPRGPVFRRAWWELPPPAQTPPAPPTHGA